MKSVRIVDERGQKRFSGQSLKTAQETPTDSSLIEFSVDKRTITKSAANALLIQLLLRGKGIITMPIMTYYLKPAELGIFNLILVTSNVLFPLVTLNMTDGPAILFAREKDISKVRSMYMTVVNFCLLSMVLFGLISIWLSTMSSHRSLTLLPLAVVVLFSNIMYKLPQYILATYQKTSLLVKNAFFRDISTVGLSLALVSLGFSYKGLVFATVLCTIVAAVSLSGIVLRSIPYAFVLSASHLRTFLPIAIPLIPVFFFSWIIQSSDSYLLLYFKGEAAVGQYSVVYSFAGVILTLTAVLNFFWFPVSARLWAEDQEKFRRGFQLVFFSFVAVLMVAVVGFELNSMLLMRFLVSNAAYFEAHSIIGLIAFAFAMQVIITLLTAPLYSNSNTGAILGAYSAGAIVNILLNAMLIPSMGISGAAASTAIAYLLTAALMIIFNQRMAGFVVIDRRLAFITIVFIGAWAMALWARQQVGLIVTLLVDVGFVGVAGALFYFIALVPEERQYLVALLAETRPQKVGS